MSSSAPASAATFVAVVGASLCKLTSTDSSRKIKMLTWMKCSVDSGLVHIEIFMQSVARSSIKTFYHKTGV